MMIDCYPLLLIDDGITETPSLKSVINGLYYKNEVPLKIMTEKDDEFKEYIHGLSNHVKPLYVIVVIKYLNSFEA